MCLAIQHSHSNLQQLSILQPKGGKIRLYGLLGGQVRIHVQSMRQTREVWGHAPLGNFDFGTFIRCNLLESGTVFAQTIYCVINTLLRIGLIYI